MVRHLGLCRKYSLSITNPSARVLLLRGKSEHQKVNRYYTKNDKGLLQRTQRKSQRTDKWRIK